MEVTKLANTEKPQRQRVAEVVSKEIQEMIVSELKSGDKLPPESELASMYDVSRSSIRESIQMLESIGIVEKRNGGTFVASTPKECFVEPLNLMIQMNFVELSDVLEMRMLLELEAVRLAVLNADSEEIRNLENLLWMMQKPDLVIDEFIDIDTQFHFAIAEASENMVLYHFVKNIITVLAKFTDKVCLELNNSRDIAVPMHKKTLDGIKTKNVNLALEGMLAHLSSSEDGVCEEYLVKNKKDAVRDYGRRIEMRLRSDETSTVKPD